MKTLQKGIEIPFVYLITFPMVKIARMILKGSVSHFISKESFA